LRKVYKDKPDKTYDIKAKYNGKTYITQINFKNTNSNDITYNINNDDILNEDFNPAEYMDVPKIKDDMLDPSKTSDYIGDVYAKTKYGFLS
jgi:hypothetical protein